MIRMLLRALGWLFYNLERLRMRCLGTYKTSLCRCGENSYVGGGVSLSHPENWTQFLRERWHAVRLARG